MAYVEIGRAFRFQLTTGIGQSAALSSNTHFPSWSVSDTTVAGIDSTTGVLIGKKSGSVLVTAAVDGAAPTAEVIVAPGILVGAGDIASCESTDDEETASLLDAIAGTVFTAGDNVYEHGTYDEYLTCYDPSWGRHRPRTRPAPGNHEYMTGNAQGYFQYFASAAGDSSRGYYSYDLASWHIIVLNSTIDVRQGSAQERWVRADLAAHPSQCALAYWHFPRFSSGFQGNHPEMSAIWQALYDAGVDVVVSGHDHDYERFSPQTASGQIDWTQGIREFVVGTGGKSHLPFQNTVPNSEVRDETTFGVLLFKLFDDHYEWKFLPTRPNGFTDSGQAFCH